jgi:SAM-dependent methyltransferase
MPSAPPERRVRYDGLADWYDLNSGLDDDGAEALRALVGPEAGRCLDLGCGTGQHFSLLAACGGRVVGLDVSLDQLHVSRRRHPALVRAEAESLPFRSGVRTSAWLRRRRIWRSRHGRSRRPPGIGAAYPEEIDARLAANDEAVAHESEIWERRQRLLGG